MFRFFVISQSLLHYLPRLKQKNPVKRDLIFNDFIGWLFYFFPPMRLLNVTRIASQPEYSGSTIT